MSVGEPAISAGRSEAIEALVAGLLSPSTSELLREVPASELAALTGISAEELVGQKLQGLQVWPDLDRAPIAFDERAWLGVLRHGWLWVDQAFFDAVVSSGSRGDTARALVRRAAVMTARAAGHRELPEVRLPEVADLDQLRSSNSLYPFRLFTNVRGSAAVSAPEFGERAVPEAVAGVAMVITGLKDGGVQIGSGCVVEMDPESIWIVTARHRVAETDDVAVNLGDASCRATMVPADGRLLVEALAEERSLAVDGPEVEAYARGLDLALLRVDRREHPDAAPVVIPLAPDLTDPAPAITMGYSSHERVASALENFSGDRAANVVLVSVGTLEPAPASEVGPTVDFLPTPVTAREAGGGQALLLGDDPWPTRRGVGGPVLVEVGEHGGAADVALAGVALSTLEVEVDSGVLHLLLLADSGAVRALLRARPRVQARR